MNDKTFVIQLKKPFASILYALGVSGCFIMPEQVAKTDPFKQITDATGSGPFKFVKDEWVAGAKAVWVKNDKYVPRMNPPTSMPAASASTSIVSNTSSCRMARQPPRRCRPARSTGSCAADRSGADAEIESRRDHGGV